MVPPSQAIHRHRRTKNFSIVDNDIFEQVDISWRARMILLYLLSKPDDWVVREGDIINHGPCGRDAVRTALKELKTAGYIKKAPIRDSVGKIAEWKTYVYDEPQKADEATDPSRLLKTQSLAEPDSGKPDTTKYLYKPRTKRTHTLREETTNAGVCNSASLQEENQSATKPLVKPANPLALIADRLKKLGVNQTKALKSAAHGLSDDQLVNACNALEEVLESGGVRSKAAWLRSAFQGLYEPSSDWVSKEEAEAKLEETRRKEAEAYRTSYLKQQDTVQIVQQSLKLLERRGEISVLWDESTFSVGERYAYIYPNHPEWGTMRRECTRMPDNEEAVAKRKAQVAEFEARLRAKNAA